MNKVIDFAKAKRNKNREAFSEMVADKGTVSDEERDQYYYDFMQKEFNLTDEEIRNVREMDKILLSPDDDEENDEE